MLVHALGVVTVEGAVTTVANNVASAVSHQQLGNSRTGRAHTGKHNTYILDVLANYLQGVD